LKIHGVAFIIILAPLTKPYFCLTSSQEIPKSFYCFVNFKKAYD